MDKVQFNALASIQFNQGYVTDAVRRTGTTKRAEVQAMRSEQLRMSPQKLGNYATRLRMTDQTSKTVQTRFKDLFA